ncbi:MAG: hypothetical protein RLZZ618_814 [Pseudomonadota bacterium]|jgi:hypothetical protein
MSQPINNLSVLAATPTSGKSDKSNWFEAMAEAWGQALDQQADKIQTIAGKISGGDDQPATVTQLTAESLKMGFLSNSSHTALTSVGSALETMARKG